MDQVVSEVVAALNAMHPNDVNGKGQRRFFDQIEIPMARHLGLDVPSSKQDPENVYVTWVDSANNIDNRLWQVQNKLMKGMSPRIAIALCSDRIVDDRMWLESARNLSRFAPYMSSYNFEGLALFSTDDDRQSFAPRRLILLRGGTIGKKLSESIPEILTEWYSAPLATRRPAALNGSDETNEIMKLLRLHRNVILKGVSGIGKSHVLGPIAAEFGDENVELVVFHPNSTYEDFVEALRPIGAGNFDVVDGRFLSFCKRAAMMPDKEFLFIIDEINRAPVARVLGDLLYAIDPSKRINAAVAHEILNFDDSGTKPKLHTDQLSRPVTLQLQRVGPKGPYRALFCVPDNVYLLATRNTSDQSIGSIDIALSRRFHTRRLEPLNAARLLALLSQSNDRMEMLRSEVLAWSRMNDVLQLTSPDACLGHSYFFDAIKAAANLAEDDDEELIRTLLWRDYILPQLAEILETFDCAMLLPQLFEASCVSESLTGGYWIEPRGTGIDIAYLLVERRATSVANTQVPPTFNDHATFAEDIDAQSALER